MAKRKVFRGRTTSNDGPGSEVLLSHAKSFWAAEEEVARMMASRKRMLVTAIFAVTGITLVKATWIPMAFWANLSEAKPLGHLAALYLVLSFVYFIVAYLLAAGTVKGNISASWELRLPSDVVEGEVVLSDHKAKSLIFATVYAASLKLQSKNIFMRNRLALSGYIFSLALILLTISLIISMSGTQFYAGRQTDERGAGGQQVTIVEQR